MLKIEKFVTASPEQWEIIIEGMRNPKNSWDRMDSIPDEYFGPGFYIGENDHNLMMRLANGGPVHAKYRRMIPAWVTLTAPLYWWKEFDTYKVGTVANSCSTMHKIQAKEFTLEDFSCEHLGVTVPAELNDREEVFQNLWVESLKRTIEDLNIARSYYIREQNADLKKQYWWQMIQLLPTSYNQKRTVMLNYEVLHNIYFSRKDHKLDEWHVFCDWIKELPYSEIIIGEKEATNA